MFHAVLERNKLMSCLFWYVLMFLFTNFDWCLSSWQDATICRHFTGTHIPKFPLSFEKPSLFRESSSWKCIPKMQFIDVYWIYWNPYFSLVKYIQLLWFFLLNSVEYRLSQHQSVFQGKSAGVGPFQRGRRGLRFKWLAPRAACWSSRFLAHVQGSMYGAFSCVWLPYQICHVYI